MRPFFIKVLREKQGNTPAETFSGKPIALNAYKIHFQKQKTLRISSNQQNRCKNCN